MKTIGISIEVDTTLHAAYVRLSEEKVVKSIEFDEDILIDLDGAGRVVGIEILDSNVRLPFDELLTQYQVSTEVVGLLKMIRPDVDSYLEFTSGVDGASEARRAEELTPA